MKRQKTCFVSILDEARIPSEALPLEDGQVLSLGGRGPNVMECFVASVLKSGSGCVIICNLCGNRLVEFETYFELGEAKLVRHLRSIHSVKSTLWSYTDDLKVFRIF